MDEMAVAVVWPAMRWELQNKENPRLYLSAIMDVLRKLIVTVEFEKS